MVQKVQITFQTILCTVPAISSSVEWLSFWRLVCAFFFASPLLEGLNRGWTYPKGEIPLSSVSIGGSFNVYCKFH